MKRILAAAGTTVLAVGALVIARRRAAKCPWTAAEAKRVRDGLDVAAPGHAYRTMFASLEQPRDS
jgi:hypothetical protein